MSIPSFDLHAAIRRALTDRGFAIEPDPAAQAEADAAVANGAGTLSAAIDAAHHAGARDLRDLLWSSIDDVTSRDLDQVEWAESAADGAVRVRVGIADVDALVPRGSAIDVDAMRNATSVYAGVRVFPMLPVALSEGLTSLLEGEDRLAVVVELLVAPDGTVARADAYRAIVHNHAKLAYEAVGAWLEGGALPDAIARIPGLEAQLTLQREAARRLKAERRRAGALEFETIEARPVARDGVVVDLAVVHKSLARELIEDFMIAAKGIRVPTRGDSPAATAPEAEVSSPQHVPATINVVSRLAQFSQSCAAISRPRRCPPSGCTTL